MTNSDYGSLFPSILKKVLDHIENQVHISPLK